MAISIALKLLVIVLQTLRGQQAKACTSEEFFEVMMGFKEAVEYQMSKHNTQFDDELGERVTPVYFYDRPNLHKHAEPALVAQGINASMLSHYSPDMNKPIEHVFAVLQSQMQIYVREVRSVQTVDKYQTHLQGLFRNLQRDSIKKDVESLHATYQSILDANGDWAAAHLS